MASCSYVQHRHCVPRSVQQAFPELPHATLSTVLWTWTFLLPTSCHKHRNLSSLGKRQGESPFQHFLIPGSTSTQMLNVLFYFIALNIDDTCIVKRYLQAASDFLLWDSFLKGRITGSKSRHVFFKGFCKELSIASSKIVCSIGFWRSFLSNSGVCKINKLWTFKWN